MKRIVLLCWFALGITTFLVAATATVNGITWTYQVSNGEAQIFNDWNTAIPTSTSGAITIPSTLGGYPVTSIGDSAFSGCEGLTSVAIPEGVTSIGSFAFVNCSSLTSVMLPSSLTYIVDYAFANCERLTLVTIPKGVTSIGRGAFVSCNGMTSFIVDSNNQKFSSKDGLLLSKDGTQLISCPRGLSSVTIPTDVTSIEVWAFAGCVALTTLTIPEGVVSIGFEAFVGCVGLSSFVVDSNNKNFSAKDGLLLNKDGTLLVSWPSASSSVTIPKGITVIGDGAFSCCEGLTSATIPECVTSIGEAAFAWCYNLTFVTIPEGVTSIGATAFHQAAFTSIIIPSSVTSIGGSAFSECYELTLIDFNGAPPRVVDEVSGVGAVFPSANGTYLPEYASEWEAVIDADGKWQGLTMSCKVSKFPVEVAVNGEGAVTGAGSYAPGDSVTLTATPNKGFVFCGWSEPSAKSATYSFTMPEKAVSLTAYFAPKAAVIAYVAMNNLMSKDEAVQEALDADEVFTADEMKALALGAPVIQVKDGKATVSIQVQQASELDGEWEVVEDGEVSVEITPKAGEKAGFYKFVVPNQQ